MAAVDLGASSGRVMVARAGPGELTLREVHRFGNVPVRAGGTLHWDILRLYADVLEGLRAGQAETSGAGGLASVGIDSWGVDYGLLDRTGALLGNPVHYRDARTDGAADLLGARIAADGRYAATGIQELPFNTIYQLTAAAGTPQLDAADTLLLIPDLLGYWLTGQTGAEFTNASTTQLLDVRTGDWAWPLIAAAGIPRHIFPPVRSPGSVIGPVRDDISGLAGLPVVAVGSHDTASAVVAVPAQNRDFAYISSGTWSLVGMELDEPVLSDASRLANFTNEAGVDGRIRYLHNVTGLWLLQESLRVWATGGHTEGRAGGHTDGRRAAARAVTRAVARRTWPACWRTRPGCLRWRRWSMRTTPYFCRPATCRTASAPRAPAWVTRCPPARRRSSAASSTAWPWRTGGRLSGCRSCPGGTRTSFTWSAAAPGTNCSASSPPTRAGCR